LHDIAHQLIVIDPD
jgi:hypothetical protein